MKILKKFILNIIYWSGFNYLYSLFQKDKIFVIMYHSIVSSDKLSPQNDLYSHLSIDAGLFEKEMIYLKKRGHTFITFSELKSLSGKKINKPTIIYFDDGFKNIFTTAIPIMKRHGIKGTLFPVTGILDKTEMIWTILYRAILTKEGVTREKQNILVEELKMKNEDERKKIMSKYDLSDHQDLFEIFLDWNDIKSISESGFEIGSHGVSHTKLTEINPQEFKHEAQDSKERLEKEIERPIYSFSFPHGRSSKNLAEELGKYGYKYAVSKGLGLNPISDLPEKVAYLKNISPKPQDTLTLFKLRVYAMNLNK